jgi:hypothetical protein
MRLTSVVARFGSLALAVAALGFGGRPALAQESFDQQFNRNLSNLMAQNNNRMEQLWQYHLKQNGPRLQKQYREFLANGGQGITYAQFAYYDMMTAAGTNVAGGMQAQRDQFNGLQIAHRTVQSGYDSYNAGSRLNSDRAAAAVERFSNTAILGNAPYINPITGATTMLPYSLPVGQNYTWGGYTYQQDAAGTYYQWNGYGWQSMRAGR